jgi:hypothetical protein
MIKKNHVKGAKKQVKKGAGYFSNVLSADYSIL